MSSISVRPFRDSMAPEPRRLCAVFAASVAAIVLASGCEKLLPFQSVPANAYQCAAKVEVKKLVPLNCADYIKPTSQQAQKIELAVFSNSDPTQYPKLYVDQDWVPTADGFADPLKGACLVRVPSADHDSTAHPYLELSFAIPLVASDRVFVAFDLRAKTLPPWLSASFKPVDGAILVSTEKHNPGPGFLNVRYQVYELENPLAFANKVTFDGNNLGTVWLGGVIGEQYLVFVKKTQTSQTTSDTFPITIEACKAQQGATSEDIYSTVTTAQSEQTILDDWIADHKEYEQAYRDGQVKLSVLPSDCGPVASITKPSYPKECGKADVVNSSQHNLVVNAWPRQSTAAIDASLSRITIQARGVAQTVPASGPISFRIDENSNLIIDELTLFTEITAPLVIQGTQIENVGLGQRGAFMAQCADAMVPKAYGLCGKYSIAPSHTAVAGLGANVDGKHVFVALVNKRPIAIDVDHNLHVFHLSGGGIGGRLATNDGPVDVDLSLDVTGNFLNFAPVASMKESPTKFECKDSNKGFVTLDASASYDVDQSPASLLYRWVEDAGMLTERLLGNQKRITNLPMNFGGHRITLSVEDNQGAIATITADVEVTDSKIDSYDIPVDIYAVTQGRSTLVPLPVLKASDACSGHVLITNNAPANMRFAEGLTPVEWLFDDFRGNVIVQRQSVFVVPEAMYPPPIATGYAVLNAAAQGQSLMYSYGTKAMGKAISADEYILLETPGGKVFSFGERNQLGPPGEILRHGSARAFGGADTGAFLVVNQWDAKFPDKGTYGFRYFLVRAGGDPKNSRFIVAYHRFDLTQ